MTACSFLAEFFAFLIILFEIAFSNLKFETYLLDNYSFF